LHSISLWAKTPIKCSKKAGRGMVSFGMAVTACYASDEINASLNRRNEAVRLFGEVFCRMWEFYFASCEAGFHYGGLMVFQIQLAKQIDAVP
jgi:hypothetical protein